MRKLALAPIAAAVMAFGSPAMAVDNSLTWQGVTFQTTIVDSDTIEFSILDATSATGNWTGINYLKAFELKEIGNVTGATITPNNLVPVDLNLSANGCVNGNQMGMCFVATSPLSLTNSMTWTIDFVGTNLDFSSPHLKVDFWTNEFQSKATGDLLSQTITTAIPEPETYAMLLAGLGLMGFVARRRQRNLAA